MTLTISGSTIEEMRGHADFGVDAGYESVGVFVPRANVGEGSSFRHFKIVPPW